MEQSKELATAQQSTPKSNTIFSAASFQNHYLPILNNSNQQIMQIQSTHNQQYLSIVHLYLTQILFEGENLSKLRQTIETAELMVVQRHTLPKHLQHIYEIKSIRSAVIASLSKLAQMDQDAKQRTCEVENIIAEPIVGLGFILVIRYFALKCFQKQKQQIWILGSEEKAIKDYREDASGNVFRLIAEELKIKIAHYACNRATRTYIENTFNQRGTHCILSVTQNSKLYMVSNLQQPTSVIQKETQLSQIKLNSVYLIEASQMKLPPNQPNSLQLEADTSIISSSGQAKGKNCPKCGRVKTEKFCVCRKSRDDSVPKVASKFQPAMVTPNCRKCFLNRPLLGQYYCRECKVKLGK